MSANEMGPATELLVGADLPRKPVYNGGTYEVLTNAAMADPGLPREVLLGSATELLIDENIDRGFDVSMGRAPEAFG